MRAASRILAAVAALIAAIAGALALLAVDQWNRAASAQAPYEGAFSVSGVSSPTRIVRDGNAVPHIVAQTDDDACFALGFVHAQDRLWQMDLARRSAQGRLAEVLGSAALSSDIFNRALNFRASVEASWPALEPATRARLEAYAAGVNAWMSEDAFRKPAEYVLTMSALEPWRPTDALYVGKAVALVLSQNLGSESLRARMARDASPAAASEFLRPYPVDGHVAMAWPDLQRTLGLPDDGDPATSDEEVVVDPASENSNNWVVSGARAANGAPMLASDPHLRLTMPGFWYLARLQVGDRFVVGATIPGLPGVIVGRNHAMAWAVTNNRADVQDAYLERLNPDAADEYETPKGWRRFEDRQETIKVRFAKDVTRTFRTSRHGPVLPADAFARAPFDPETHALALSWAALIEPDTTADAMTAGLEIDSIETFLKLFRHRYVTPVQTFAFAHVDGTIGLMAAGRTPVRGPDHENGGGAPANGADSANDWVGTIPPELTPVVLNPSSGALVSANGKITPDAYPYFLARDYAPPSRQQRIADLLAARNVHDMASFRAIQNDVETTIVGSLTALMLKVELDSPSPDEAAALDALRAWDGAWRKDARGAAVFANWTRELAKALYEDDLGDGFARAWRYDPWLLRDALSGETPGLCDAAATEAVEACGDLLAPSFRRAVEGLVAEHGDVAPRWGEVYETRHDHLGLAALPLVGERLARSSYRAAGPDAPNVGYFDFAAMPAAFVGKRGASVRLLFDLSDPSKSFYAAPSGQSGHFGSPHYDDLIAGWAAGDYFNIAADVADIATPREITLAPAAE
ncbi:MAG: penicillin acylase family protein [Parvularculaceae bacterium]